MRDEKETILDPKKKRDKELKRLRGLRNGEASLDSIHRDFNVILKVLKILSLQTSFHLSHRVLYAFKFVQIPITGRQCLH